ncbi:hypothetical protein AQJ67_05070 [Streptomyces caeruleatus]|uniref:Uncharacterized protein n=1 Tax=Streptomyces caeruleatus TaxID=661399 RepID=A0A117RRN4_9ACTN|nr:hypothetical protein AQJ67_05070 [Streptomyces caeruleatus]
MECQDIGGALLVHPEGEIDPRVRAFVAGLAKDPEHTLVVVDLPADPPTEDWESVAGLLQRRGRSFRVVIGRPSSRETAMTVGQLLADRLDRTVLTPDGRVLPAAGGVLFVPEDGGSGWLGFRPRRSSVWTRLAPHRPAPRVSRRFPAPDWDHAVPQRSFATSVVGTAEPLPAGVWIRRTDQPANELDVHRRRLAAFLRCQTDRLTVVLGCPGPDLPLAEIERFWGCVAPDARPLVRFVPYGPVGAPEDKALGQILADRLGHEVTLYAGLPTVGDPGTDGTLTRVLGEDGTPGPTTFVRELVYRQAGANGSVELAPPALLGLRPPVDGLPEVLPGVYEYAPDAVLEVTQSGLWLRPPTVPVDVTAVYHVPPDRTGLVIHFDAGTSESAERMRSLAEEVRQRLGPELAAACRVLPAPKETTGNLSRVGAPHPPGAHEPTSVPGPAPVSVEDEPGAAAGASVPATGQSGTAGHSGREAGVTEPGLVPARDERGPAAEVAGPAAGGPGPVVDVPDPATGVAGPAVGERAPAFERRRSTPESVADDGGSAVGVSGSAGDGSVPVAGVSGPVPGPVTHGPGPVVAPAEPAPGSAAGEPAPGAAVPTPAPGHPGSGSGVPGPAPGSVAGEPVPVVEIPGPAGESGHEGPVPEAETGRIVPAAESAEPEPVSLTPGTAATPAVSAGPTGPDTEEAQLTPPPAPMRPRSLRLESAPPVETGPVEPSDASAAGAEAMDLEIRTGPAPRTTALPAPPTPSVPTPVPAPVPAPVLDSASPAAHSSGPPGTPVVPAASGPSGAQGLSRAPEPSGTPTPAPTPTAAQQPRAQQSAVRVQPVPGPEACAAPPERGIEQERSWLRRTFKEQYGSAANHVARVLSESPGLRGASRQSAEDVVTDLVAVRLYLSGGTDRIDSAVRSGKTGPHVPLARCVASGLRRLPSYRGATLLRTTLSEAEWQWYGKRRLVTEWAFCSALTTAHPELAGDVDVLIWSMTARRTALLDATVPDRVLYLPGTSFKVLGVRDAERRVLLRELTGPEIGADGSVDLRRLPLDDIAMAGLEQAATEWQDAKPATRLPAAAAGTLRHPPGLIVTGRSAAPRSADTAPPRKGTTP